MRHDSLVHVAATGGYGSVFEVHDGVCEVGLIDPTADEYSITVPQSAVQEMDPVGDSARAALLGHLVLFHLRVNWRLRLALSFEAFAGREEGGALERVGEGETAVELGRGHVRVGVGGVGGLVGQDSGGPAIRPRRRGLE